MKDGGGFEKLWKNEAFTSRLISFVWDEAHCISTWSHFREEYKDAYRLRYLLPKVPFYLASATLSLLIDSYLDISSASPTAACDTHHRGHRSPGLQSAHTSHFRLLIPQST